MIKKVEFSHKEKKIGGLLYKPDPEKDVNSQNPESDGQKFPAVVLVHGFGGGTHELKNRYMCEQLSKEGFVAFMFDFYDQPNGLSEIQIEKTNVSLQLKVLQKALDYLSGLDFVDSNRIGLTGHSLGGMTVFLYTPTDERIKALVVQSAVSDFGQTRNTALKFNDEWKEQGYKVFDKKWGEMKVDWEFIEDGLKHDVYAAIEKIKCPVLIFHGDKDESVPLEQAEKQVKHLQNISQDNPNQLVIIKGADHCYKINDTLPEATKLLIDFMKKKLL